MAAEVKLVWHGGAVEHKYLRACEDAVLVGMEFLLTESNKTVPLDNSILEHTGVAAAERDGDKITGIVSYNTPYAVRQHEELTYRHAPGRRAKWLELTLHERADVLQKLIATQVRRRTGGAGAVTP
jgi:hypothetical protein